MRTLLTLLIYSNSWVALCLSMLVLGLGTYFRLAELHLFFFWSFCSTVSAYQLHRLFRLKQLEYTVRSNRRLLWMQKTYTLQICWFVINFLCCVLLTVYLPFSKQSLLLLLVNCVVVGLYALPLPFIGNGIRNLPFMKNILISLSWTIIVLLPLASENHQIPWILPIIIAVSVFAQIIPFDARDVAHDLKSMFTIPQLVGLSASKYIGFGIFAFALTLQFVYLNFHWLYFPILVIAAFGHFFPFKVGYQLRLEFMWELPLGLMGLWFLMV